MVLPLSDLRRIDAVLRLHAIVQRAAPDAAPALFAHLRVTSGHGTRDVLFGERAVAFEGVSVVDWRTSRFTELLVGGEEGDEWQLTIDRRRVRGTLLEKNLVRLAADRVVEIIAPDTVYSWREEDGWTAAPATRQVRLDPRPPAVRERPVVLVDVVLDHDQQAIVALPADRSLLLLGEAGHGKTTVALHRLAWLRKRAEGKMKAVVVVPSEGLRRLVDAALARLGVHDVEAWVYDRFAARQARWAFPGIPRRESDGATAGVVRLKRHAALLEILSALVAEEAAPETTGRARRRGAVDPPTRRDALLHLFGDRRWMELVIAQSEGSLPGSALADVLEHTHVQFSDTTEREYAHVDAARLATLDGRAIDDGTAMGDAGTIDAEDYAVMFELDRRRARRQRANARQPRRYDCVVIDEAQELAPAELALLGRSIKPGGTLVVAGDADQQVDPAACFGGWPQTLASLGIEAHDEAVLAMSYRCPPGVTAMARAILHGGAGMADAAVDGSVTRVAFADDCHLLVWLATELRHLREDDPSASIAVITRTPEHARLVAAALHRGLGVRLVLEGDFGARAGTKITCVREVKGLEFDHVVVPDASATTYPDAPDARRALYVAATRAIHQLVLATGSTWTPILPAA